MDEKETVYGSRKTLTELANSIYESTGKSATILSDWSLSEVRPNNKSLFNAQPYTQEPIEYLLTSTGLIPRVDKKYLIPKIEKVIYDIPNNTTIVYFDDGTKEIARVMDGDTFDKEVGVMQCIVKKMYGNRSQWLKEIVNKGIEGKPKKVKEDNHTTCNGCANCADNSLKHLCFDKPVRDELLTLIEEGIKTQMDTENFLYKRGYTVQMMNDLAFGVRMHFDCMLPDKDQV